jgi:hypothetical protein
MNATVPSFTVEVEVTVAVSVTLASPYVAVLFAAAVVVDFSVVVIEGELDRLLSVPPACLDCAANVKVPAVAGAVTLLYAIVKVPPLPQTILTVIVHGGPELIEAIDGAGEEQPLAFATVT